MSHFRELIALLLTTKHTTTKRKCPKNNPDTNKLALVTKKHKTKPEVKPKKQTPVYL